VRRVYSAKGRADRAVENVASFAHQESAEQSLQILAAELGLTVERMRGIPYVWRERRSETLLPTREDYLTVAPAAVDDKARYGLPWFEQKWTSLQLRLSKKARLHELTSARIPGNTGCGKMQSPEVLVYAGYGR
jgi:hypothetical protein